MDEVAAVLGFAASLGAVGFGGPIAWKTFPLLRDEPRMRALLLGCMGLVVVLGGGSGLIDAWLAGVFLLTLLYGIAVARALHFLELERSRDRHAAVSRTRVLLAIDAAALAACLILTKIPTLGPWMALVCSITFAFAVIEATMIRRWGSIRTVWDRFQAMGHPMPKSAFAFAFGSMAAYCGYIFPWIDPMLSAGSIAIASWLVFVGPPR